MFSFLAFSVIRGDPAIVALGLDATEQQLQDLRHQMGLDRSIPVRYFNWLSGFFMGDLGQSVHFHGESVSSLVSERLPVSFFLSLLALCLTVMIALPFSMFSVRRENGIADKAASAATAFGISIPNFFLGVLLIWVFAIGLRFFEVGSYIDYRVDFAGFIVALFFPALAIAVPNAAILAKFLRASLFKEQRGDYFRTARSKGATLPHALRCHALRNAIIPSITVMGMIIAETFSGSIIIEQVFAVPGIGRLLIAAITSRDYPVIQVVVVMIAITVIIANTLVDIAIQIIDPRIKLDGSVADKH
jgi:ABC-type dipeptide/oligopeptide/nickel transport system permease component